MEWLEVIRVKIYSGGFRGRFFFQNSPRAGPYLGSVAWPRRGAAMIVFGRSENDGQSGSRKDWLLQIDIKESQRRVAGQVFQPAIDPNGELGGFPGANRMK